MRNHLEAALDGLRDLGIGFETGPAAFEEKRPTRMMVHGAGRLLADVPESFPDISFRARKPGGWKGGGHG